MSKAGRWILLFMVLSGLGWGIWLFSHQDSPLFRPIEYYEVEGDLNFLSTQSIDQVLSAYFGVSFWQVELDKIQMDLQRLEWVAHATVKRQWPNRIYIKIQEQVPVARWGESGFVNAKGQLFFPKEQVGFEHLVRLQGERERASEIVMAFERFQALLEPLEFFMVSLEHHLDGVWRMKLSNGSEIILGSKQEDDKLNTFVRAYPQLLEPLRNSAQAYDLRYSNGFIVGNVGTRQE